LVGGTTSQQLACMLYSTDSRRQHMDYKLNTHMLLW
jgi:hypothetical protein